MLGILTIEDMADRIAKRTGWIRDGYARRAATGSCYCDLWRKCVACGSIETTIRIRFSDHSECYPPSTSEVDEQITVGLGGITEGELIQLLLRWPPNENHECEA